MATGRIIRQKITANQAVNHLKSDRSRLGFTWILAFLDCEGRVDGDESYIRSLLFPRRQDVNNAKMLADMEDWGAVGLVLWYYRDGFRFGWFPGFERNQINLRKDREPSSTLPAPTAEELRVFTGLHPAQFRQASGIEPEKSPQKGREGKGREFPSGEEEGKGAGAPSPPPSGDDSDSEHLSHPLVLEYRQLWRNGGRIADSLKPSTVKAVTELLDLPEFNAEEAITILRRLRRYERRFDDKGFPYIATAVAEHLSKGTMPGLKKGTQDEPYRI